MGRSALRSAFAAGTGGPEARSETMSVRTISPYSYIPLRGQTHQEACRFPFAAPGLPVRHPDLLRGQRHVPERDIASPAIRPPGVRHEQALPETRPPERADQRLGLGRDQKVRERLATGRVHARCILRIHLRSEEHTSELQSLTNL